MEIQDLIKICTQMIAQGQKEKEIEGVVIKIPEIRIEGVYWEGMR